MTSVRPPNAPWIDLKATGSNEGYLSFYYSDDMSALPVRWVTKPGDNKSDPNIETCSYGVFSTCSPRMRSGIVNKRRPVIFFCTRTAHGRVLTGYYKVRWHTHGPLGPDDVCLAAETCHFVRKPLKLADLDARLGTDFSKPFRGFRVVSTDHCERLRELIERQQNVCADYVAEIDRLERFNLKHGGFRYISWKQAAKFDWNYACNYLVPRAPARKQQVASATNASPSGFWNCSACNHVVKNKALLKRCPNCGELGTLQPQVG